MHVRLRHTEALSERQLEQQLHGNAREQAAAILAAARSGAVQAQLLLGQILLDGRGIQHDPPLAFIWFGIAPRHGDAMAHNMLGRCHEHGWGCAPDPALAASHYRAAAAQSLDWGLYNLANLLATGRGVKQDHIQARMHYQQAAALGHAKSMNLLGRCYEEGVGIERNAQQALHWYQRSAVAGDFRGQFSYAAVLISQGQLDTARHWLEQALQGGHLPFLRQACEQLQAAGLSELNDSLQAYRQRCRELTRNTD